jgi:hypothetical protein
MFPEWHGRTTIERLEQLRHDALTNAALRPIRRRWRRRVAAWLLSLAERCEPGVVRALNAPTLTAR